MSEEKAITPTFSMHLRAAGYFVKDDVELSLPQLQPVPYQRVEVTPGGILFTYALLAPTVLSDCAD